MKLLVCFLLIAGILDPDVILRLSGASTIEELSEEQIEHFENLSENPLDINLAGQHALQASGLFSSYQIATLLDHISRYGHILSVAELATVDGFGRQRAMDLSPFIRFSPSAVPGRKESRRSSAKYSSTFGYRDGAWTGTIRLKGYFGSRITAYSALRSDFSSVSGSNISLSYTSDGILKSAVIGDLNLRLGEGLLVWSGMSLSGVPTADSFSKSGSGLTASSSLSAGMRGAGLSLGYSGASLDMGLGIDGSAAARIGYRTLRSTLGLSAVRARESSADKGLVSGMSADIKTTLGRWTLFGEGAVDLTDMGTAALAGAVFNHSYAHRFAALIRAYAPNYRIPTSGAVRSSTRASDEYGVSLGATIPGLSLSLDAAYHPSKDTYQTKGILVYSRPWEDLIPGLSLTPSVRAALRWKSGDKHPYRSELRGSVSLGYGNWIAAARADLAASEGIGWLWYAETGYKTETAEGFLRFTLFKADSWQDRIYVYERDVPGSFNIPAYYGRGWALAGYAGYAGFKLRVGYVCYPWIKKEPHLEVRLMYQNRTPRVRPKAAGEELNAN